ncbi:MAG: UDP-N-acetylglucosamine 2-epimerase (non-hydrolyzing) [Gammaproteobacteria bacterium]|nr:UDP-N-acetylglucosamine 2-epimerase (non-hydrolyzing) [Gammaproteobacteria bacterium]
MTSKNIHLIAAARPNFMKIAPLFHALSGEAWCSVKLIHTGQHYDVNMSDAFFNDLGLPKPDFHLGVGSGSHAEQTAGVMVHYEKVCLQDRPNLIIVVGDVNSTVACALVGAKLHIPVAHLEAGLRSGDRKMPEEINRLVTDRISSLLWTPSRDGDENLIKEGVDPAAIECVGNIMIDSYELQKEKIQADNSRARYCGDNSYAVITLHRPSNVDDKSTLSMIINQLQVVSKQIQLIFAIHPRTRKNLEAFNLFSGIQGNPGFTLIEPIGYIQFMNLVSGARMIITDSGGIQEETTYLGIPCLTLRDTTERPITITQGTNKLVEPENLLSEVENALHSRWQTGTKPELWDGKTAFRVRDSIIRFFKLAF